MARVLMKGNEAIGEAAIAAGCRYFFGYPITPQNEVPEYLSKRLPEVGGVFVQAESELAAISMVYGASGCGARAMTSSSGPGLSLKQEGMSTIAGAEVPALVVNMMRGGPGVGSIQASQADYFQSTRNGGHGDYRVLSYAPASVQEACDLIAVAFDRAEKYRMLCMIVGDGMLGQMMEPVDIKPVKIENYDKSWAMSPDPKGPLETRIVNSVYNSPDQLQVLIQRLLDKYRVVEANETRWEEYCMDDPEYVLVSYGTVSRICKNAIQKLKEKGVRVGLIRPITLWPFPSKPIEAAVARPGVKSFVAVEMSAGQMREDVVMAVGKRKPVELCNTLGSVVPTADLIADFVMALKGRK